MMKRLSLILLMVVSCICATMAQRTVEGTILDDAGEPMIGASVLAKGTSTGTVTDIDGKYSLVVPDGTTTLVVTYTGYATQEMELGASNVMDVTMAEGVTLETAVVTALGIKRDEKALGYSVQSVSGSDVSNANTVSAIDALAGKAAGVQVTSSSGAAGAGSRIVLRGQTSFNGNNEALIVIDGVRLDNSENSTERTLQGVANSNRGMDINPDDIESVSILKGAAAAALYGVEGARGVVLITTKRGKAGAMKINFNSTYTVSEANKLPDMQKKYSQGGRGEWIGPDGADPLWWGTFGRALSFGAAIDTLSWDGATDYTWDKNGRIVSQNDPTAQTPVTPYDNIDDVYELGTRWSNNISLSGGSEAVTYRFSFGHTTETGIVPKNTFDRTSVGVNLGTKLLNDKLSISGGITYVKSGGRRIQQGSNTSGLNLGLFRTPITFDNSNGFSSPENEEAAYQFPDGSQRNYRGGGGYDNPYWIINNTPFNDDVNRMFANVNLSYKLHDWATVSTTIGTDFYTDNRKQEFELNSRTFPGGQVVEDQYNYRHTDVYFNLLGNGNLTEDFSLSYNLGVNLYNKQLKQNFIQGDGLSFPGFTELANAASVVSSIDHSNEKTAAVFGSVDLGYKNFLYLTLTGRNEWVSSLISPSKEFSASDIDLFYPSASFSFVFSELITSNVLSFGKFRFSAAQVGGGAPSPYLTSTIYTVPNTTGLISSLNDGWTNGLLFPFQGTTGYTYNPLQGNPNLKPSKTTDFELGLDLRFLQDRVGIDAAVYTRKSTDQIIPINIPNSTGFQRAVVNSGELKTVGAEIVLNLTPISKPDLRWDVSLNFSTWKTTVESLPDGVPNQYLDGFTGSAIYNIAPDTATNTTYEFGQILGGAFQRANDTDASGNAIFNPDAGYKSNGALIIDDSGSPDPSSDDYNPNYGFPMADLTERVIGNPNPDFLLGINNTVTYKNLSLSFLFDIRQGGDMWNGTKGALTFFGRTKNTEDRVNVLWDDNWGPVHDYDNANHTFEGIKASDGSSNDIAVPLDENWYTGNGGGFGSVAEHFVEDASYIRLRTLSLSYNFGKAFDKIGLQGLTLSLTARNLLLITDYTGFDPDTSLAGSSTNGQGLEYFQMPGTKSYAIGLKAQF